MTSRQRIGLHPVESTGQRHELRLDPSTMVRTARFAARTWPRAVEPILDIESLYATVVMSTGGERRRWQDILERNTVVILIDANRMNPERSAAEIGWVRERIDPLVDLVLIWPGQELARMRAVPIPGEIRLFVDVLGEFQRIVSPTGKRAAVLIEPETGSIDRLSGTSPVFAIGHALHGQMARGTDRMIDLGDVYH